MNLAPTDYLSAMGGIQNLPNPTRDINAGIASAQAIRENEARIKTLEAQQRTAEVYARQIEEEHAPKDNSLLIPMGKLVADGKCDEAVKMAVENNRLDLAKGAVAYCGKN